MLATIDLAFALPTLNVVFGSRFGGGGGCKDGDADPDEATDRRPLTFLGSVE